MAVIDANANANTKQATSLSLVADKYFRPQEISGGPPGSHKGSLIETNRVYYSYTPI